MAAAAGRVSRSMPSPGPPIQQHARSMTDDAAAGEDHFGIWRPNQSTVAFQRMEQECPDALSSYARCVIDRQNSGALTQGACEDEHRAVMSCFRSVR